MKKLVILGGGESGFGAAVLGKSKGWDVFVSDSGTIAKKYRDLLEEEHGIAFEQGGHTRERVMAADEVVKSPGIPDTAPLVVELRGRGIPVISEIEFAGRYLDGARTICITGSNGKTTTTTLIYEIMCRAGLDVCLGGNIGESFACAVAQGRHDWYVLEISSFQLDGMSEFRADIAVLMNITPDHLDRYGYDMQRYIDSKMRVVRNQTSDNYFIYMTDDQNIHRELDKVLMPMRLLPFTVGSPEELYRPEGHRHSAEQGAWRDGGELVAQVEGRKFAMPLDEVRIKGVHNTYDAMAAVLAALAAGVAGDAIRGTLREFAGVEHRLEHVAAAGGVDWVNDSKATNTDSAWYALESMTRPVVWIAGGTDKGNDYATLVAMARGKVKALVALGADNSKITESFRDIIPVIHDTRSMAEAVRAARAEARQGDVVLLSPACASFDLFRNYEDRGRQFKELVMNMANEPEK